METGRGRDVAWRDEMVRQLMTPTGEVLGSGVNTEAMIRALQGAPPPPSLLTSLGVSNEFNDKLAQTNIANFGPGMVRSAVGALTLPHDAMMGQVDPMSGEGIDRARDLAGILTLGAGAMPAAEGELGMGIRAYHGSPHDFDAFDMGKIGTGEGAQVYGHGLYFAENPEVAAGYRKRLAPGTPDGVKPDAKAIEKHQSEWDAAIVERRAQAGPDGRGVSSAAVAKMDDIHSRMVADTIKRNPHLTGRQYEVSINADPEHFLDWDKPLREQPPKIREFGYSLLPKDATGADLVKLIGENTAMAQRAGIKGIRYKDAGSRFSPNWRIWSPKENGTLKWSVGNDTLGGQIQSFDNEAQARAFYKDNAPSEPTHNYVVFDDKIIDILKKYGIAGLTAGGAAAAASQQEQPSLRDTIKSAMRGGT